MSRMTEIIENHHNLDELSSIIKHYGVSAAYISNALIQMFEQEANSSCDKEEDEEEEKKKKKDEDEEETEDDEESKGESNYSPKLMEDLKQFRARF